MHNRVKALMQEEHSLTQRWAEHDLKFARETASGILPLLRLEASRGRGGGQSSHRLLRIMDTSANNQGEHGPHLLQRFHVIDSPVEREQITTAATRPATRNSSHLFGLRRSFGLQEGGRGSSALPPPAARDGTGDSAKHRAVAGGEGTATRIVSGHEEVPAPLRGRGFGGGLSGSKGSLVPFERRYRGEGFLERRRPGSGSKLCGDDAITPDKKQQQPPEDNRPTPLMQQVVRLEDVGAVGDGTSSCSESVVAVVRAVLEPPPQKVCECDCALNPGEGNQEHGGSFGVGENLGLCEVREVVRVEAYLPGSSTTLTLRVKVPATATASTRGVEGSAAAEIQRFGCSDDDPVPPLRVTVSSTKKGADAAARSTRADDGGPADTGDGRRSEEEIGALPDAGHAEECRSRKQQRRMLREARAAEARRGAAEMLAAIQDATADLSQRSLSSRENTRGPSQRQQNLVSDKRAHERRPGPKNAFSMLLIRANTTVPIERLSLTSGSWREAIGELVGCPLGQELRAVRGTRAVASRRKNPGHGKGRLLLGRERRVCGSFVSQPRCGRV